MLQGILNSLINAFDTLVRYVPSIIGALIILLVGWIIARIIRGVIVRLLRRMRVDERLKAQGGQYVERFSPGGSPARLVGTGIYVVIMFFVLAATIGALRIPALTGFMNTVLSYLPNLIAALLIFVVAIALAGAVGNLAQRAMGDTFMGRIVRTAAPTLIMAIAVFMILTQLNIAPVIVTITYIALIGALALGAALAFGLGGRDAAAEMINSAYRRTQAEQPAAGDGRERAQADAELARERARREAEATTDERSTQPGSYRAP